MTMTKARLLDQPADFERFNIDPDKVALWEEERRTKLVPGENEVWYFDATFEDQSKAVVAFRPRNPNAMMNHEDSPNANMIITTPDGTQKADFHYYDVADSVTNTGHGLDLQWGTDWAKGDYASYDIHFAQTNGVGADLHYEALVDPFRQGTAMNGFGDHDELFHSDLSVPKNRVTGTLYYDGKEIAVSGVGYHDHQWMNANPTFLYHHWLWGRMYTDKYTVYIYDFVAGAKYDFERLPMFGLMDNETGKVVFKTDGHFDLETELATQPTLKRDYPKSSHYVFKNDGGQEVNFNVTWQQELEVRDMYTPLSDEQKQQMDAMKLNVQYMRYFAVGGLTFKDRQNSQTTTSKGDMIYEYAYFGVPDARAHV